MSSPWSLLTKELDLWSEAGRTAEFWWRDDDAVAASGALDRLIDCAGQFQVPLALAVIPARADRTLAELPQSGATVLQHGFAHENHRTGGGKKTELVDDRPLSILETELRRGKTKLENLFGDRFLPVMVPPWNRIDGVAVAGLPALGFRGLSTYGARRAAGPVEHLRQVNCHVDIMRWRPHRGFLGVAPAIDLVCEHLRARREGAADSEEATGLLTHHLVHDQDTWTFLADLLAFLQAHPAARFRSAAEIFALGKT